MPPPRPRSVVERMPGYTPGEQPRPGERVVKLNTNGNPFPPSPLVVDAIRRIAPDALRRYPSSMADEFRAVAARVHGVSPENILGSQAGGCRPRPCCVSVRARFFFANPNSPSGTSVAAADVEVLAKATESLVLVDEAYADFADDNCLSLSGRQPNVLITRTLSKGHGLAGVTLKNQSKALEPFLEDNRRIPERLGRR